MLCKLSDALPIRLNASSQWRKSCWRNLWTGPPSDPRSPAFWTWKVQYWHAYWTSGRRLSFILLDWIDALRVPGHCIPQMSFRRAWFITRKQCSANFLWVSFSFTQNCLASGFWRFSGSNRKSRKERWNSLTGNSGNGGTFSTE